MCSYLLCVLVLICIGNKFVASSVLPESEINTLFDIYSATNGPNWTIPPQFTGQLWNFTGNFNPCADLWYGVYCSANVTVEDPFLHVEQLAMDSFNMRGFIPNSISNLSHLNRLYFGDNGLNGTIPKEIFEISKLQYLDLSHNYLNGSIVIPDTITTTQLIALNLINNELTESIPATIGLLQNLTQIMLDNNHLNGSIPHEIGQLGDTMICKLHLLLFDSL